MSSLKNIYEKNVAENEINLHFWENYLKDLNSLDFNVFSENLTVPILVPIGSRIFFRGQLKHTNEITVVLGADYFAKCSTKQAEVLKQHRIKDAQSKVNMYKKEREYLDKQISFSKDNIYETQGQEIIEVYTEDEDKAWREKHREHLRNYKQKIKMEQKTEKDKTVEDLWNRLEELELQEEFENELQELNNTQHLISNKNTESVIIKEEVTKKQAKLRIKEDNSLNPEINNSNIEIKSTMEPSKELEPKETFTNNSSVQTPRLDILQQVIYRQNNLENKLFELKNKERSQSKNENDLITRLDEMEQLDEIEDEMDRLDDLLETEDVEEDATLQSSMAERRVSFADNDDSSTLGLTFKHSNIESDTTPYDVDKGIQKPSDIYEAHPNLFGSSTSILKKSKYEENKISDITESVINLSNVDTLQQDYKDNYTNKTIFVKDVKERANDGDHKVKKEGRPKSLFKKMRMQRK